MVARMHGELDIPEQERKLLTKWLVEDDVPVDAMLDALEHAKPALHRKTLANAVTESAKLDPKLVIEGLGIFSNVVNTVLGLRDGEEDSQEVIRALFHAAVSEPDPQKLETFITRVNRLFTLPAVVVTAKALGVRHSTPNTFCQARTVADVRHVFTENGLKAEAAIIVHQLKILFHTGPERDLDQIFLTLTREDLDSLKRVIDRAIQKHDELKRITPSGIQLL
jgi:hypothetical protein